MERKKEWMEKKKKTGKKKEKEVEEVKEREGQFGIWNFGQFWTSFDVTWKLFRATVRMTLWAGAGFQPTAEGFPK